MHRFDRSAHTDSGRRKKYKNLKKYTDVNINDSSIRHTDKENTGSEYMIDVAKEHKYQNQSEEYNRALHKWREDPDNRYGYTYVHDTREHTYVDGEGFVDNSPVPAERQSLTRCCSLLGFTMIIMALVDFSKMLVNRHIFGLQDGTRLFYTDLAETGVVSFPAHIVYTAAAFSVLKYLLPILFFRLISGIPAKVAMPVNKDTPRGFYSGGITVMLVILALGRMGNYVIAFLFSRIGIDSTYYDYIEGEDWLSTLVFFLVQIVISPLLMELLFHGYLLQTFRQFGDLFAILVTSLMSSVCIYNPSQVLYLFCASMFVGLFTIRSGSIITALVMRISARFGLYFITYTTARLGDTQGRILDYSCCLLIFVIAMMTFTRQIFYGGMSFNIDGGNSDRRLTRKLRVMFSNIPIAVWGVIAMLLFIFSIRFVQRV